MKTLVFFMSFALSLNAVCAPKKKHAPASDGQTPHVLQMDPDFPIEQLKAPGLVLHPLSEVGKNQEALPLPVQEKFFRACGLDQVVAEWDGLDQDRLALRAEHQTPEAVVARYEGKFSLEQIQRLKQLIEQYRETQK